MGYDVRKFWSQKDFTIDALQGFGSTEYYSVTADTAAELADDRAVADATGSNGEQVPPINASHPSNRDLRVAYKSVGPGLNERVVSVRYQYAQGGLVFAPNDNPLTRKPRISWARVTTQEYVRRDIFNNPIANTAGDPFDPPPQITMASRMLTIRRHEQGYKPEISDRFENTVNSFEVVASGRRFPPGTIRVESIIPVGEYTDGAAVLEIEYQLEIKWRLFTPPGTQLTEIDRNPFYFWTFDQGSRGWYSAGDTNNASLKTGLLYHTDETGKSDEAVTSAVPLDGRGKPVDPSVVVTINSKPPIEPRSPYGNTPPLLQKTSGVWMLGFAIYRPDDLLLLGL